MFLCAMRSFTFPSRSALQAPTKQARARAHVRRALLHKLISHRWMQDVSQPAQTPSGVWHTQPLGSSPHMSCPTVTVAH